MKTRRIATAVAVLAFAAVVAPPVHRAADASAAMHMVQHLLLLFVVAPMLAYGGVSPVVSALPRPLGRWLGRTGARLPGRRCAHAMVRAPLVTWLAHVGVLWIWHWPPLYDAAVHHHGLHALEHATLVASAVLFWSPLMRPVFRTRLGFGGGTIYTFAACVQSTILGALLAVADRPWYESHRFSQFEVDAAVADQHLAGVLMWVPGGSVYLAAILAWLAAWLQESRRRTATLVLLVLLATGLQPGCRRQEPPPPRVANGDVRRGAAAIARHGCGACHRIPGIDGARGVVGPSLAGVANRTFLVGALTNEPGNLMRWIRDPQAIEPGTVMPRLGVSEADAADIVAYLYRLR